MQHRIIKDFLDKIRVQRLTSFYKESNIKCAQVAQVLSEIIKKINKDTASRRIVNVVRHKMNSK
jgi:hypothetical protein